MHAYIYIYCIDGFKVPSHTTLSCCTLRCSRTSYIPTSSKFIFLIFRS